MPHQLQEGSAPGNPPSGYVALYAKTDGNLYSKDDTGTETQLGVTPSGFLGALTSLSGTGIIVKSSSSAAVVRTIQGSSNITITYGDGVSGDPVIDLADTTVVPGSYGSATNAVSITVDAQGRITSLSETAVTGVPATNITNTPAGTISATTVQAAINELDTEKVATTRTITAGSGLSGGGDLSADRTISMPNVGTASTYGSATAVAVVTTDAQGRVSGATTTAITGVPAANITNTPAGTVSATTVQSAINELDTEKVPTTRTVSAGAGLSGGGDLSADRTISMPNVGTANTYGSASAVAVVTTDAQGRVSGASTTAISVTASAVSDFSTAADARITAQKGAANGLATLDGTVNVPLAQLAYALLRSNHTGTQAVSTIDSLATPTEVYGSIANGDTLQQALDKLNYSGSLHFQTITANLSLADGQTMIRGTTNVTGTTEITLAGSSALILVG